MPVSGGAAQPRELLAYWIGFNRVRGVGVVRLRRLIEAFGNVRAAWEAPRGELAAVGLQGRALESLLEVRRTLDLAKEMDRIEGAGITAITIEDERYPSRLREIYAAPPLLFVKGELLPADGEGVAIVGTRHATGYGKAATEKLAGELAAAGLTIVSGLARGIDSHAHKAALDANGRTVAVFACGLDVVYPPENRALVERIVRHGAAISEHPLGVRPEATNFPARNRIVSGMARATLIVEAGERSGALITAGFAADQGRDVLAVPGPITSPRSVGTNRLIQDGARLVQTAEDVLAELGLTASYRPPEQLGLAELFATGGLEDAVLTKLVEEPLGIDDLVRMLNRPSQEIATALTMLEVGGRIRQVGGLNYPIQR